MEPRAVTASPVVTESRVIPVRRYPVKAMGGESLQHVEVDARGLVGDRWFAVTDADGKIATGKNSRRFRRHDEVFSYAARTDAEGVRVRGPGGEWSVGEAALDAALTADLGTPVRVLPEGAVRHQDGGQVSLVGTASLAWCAERWGLDADPRRLRVNLLVETDEPFVEETWVGATLAIGSARFEVSERVVRCRMVDVPQDGAAAERGLLKPLGEERDTSLAVYLSVIVPGEVAVGGPVVVSRAS